MSEQKKPESMSTFFDERAGGYNHHMIEEEKFGSNYDQFAKHLPRTQASLRILDLGCGTGLELKSLFACAPNAILTGIDLSKGMLDVLRKTYPDKPITLHQDSYLTWDYPAEAYDMVFSLYTMHHFSSETKADLYAKINRTLMPGGIYLEGDYMVPDDVMDSLLQDYHDTTAHLAPHEMGAYHIDTPLSPRKTTELLVGAGFDHVQTLFEAMYSDHPFALLRAAKKGSLTA